MQGIEKRALAAYFRCGGPEQPCAYSSGVLSHNGREYVVLRNTGGVLACYRVRNDGRLKRLVRVPAGMQE